MPNRIKILLSTILLTILLICSFSWAQSLPKSSEMVNNAAKMQKQMEKMKEQIQQRQLEMLEQLKETNPEVYQQAKVRMNRQKEISQILKAFRSKNIGEKTAERQLYPLVKALVEEELRNIDSRIERAKKKLQKLQDIKQNPGKLLKAKIDQMLGRITSGHDDFLMTP